MAREGSPGDEGILKADDIGSDFVIAYHRSSMTGWLTAIAAPTAVVNAPVTRAALIFAGGALLSLLLAIVPALLIGRRIALPLQALADQADGIVRGEAVPAERHSLLEIADVRRALIKAGEIRRRQLETQLRPRTGKASTRTGRTQSRRDGEA